MFFLFKSTCPPHTVATRGCCYDFPVAAIFCLKISASGGDSVIGSYTDVSGCSACDAVLFSVAVGFFFCGADFCFGGGLFGFRRSRTVSSRSLFFFLSSSRIAGRSSFGIEASATICSSVALICPVRISSCAPGTASSAASMPREYFSARRTVADPTPCSTAIRSQVRFSEYNSPKKQKNPA